MQKDFHFYAIYVLCRCNGMSAKDSKTVAYASQYTDDSRDNGELCFTDGCYFMPVLTAHEQIHINVFEERTQHMIYVPFHFIPGADGDSLHDLTRCRKNSEKARKIVKEAKCLRGKPYQLHRLGIALHSYADTWSHDGFSGLRSDLNDIRDLKVDNKGVNRTFGDRIWQKLAEATIEKIGHVEAAHFPDVPYHKWSCEFKYRSDAIDRENWLEYQEACEAIYRVLDDFLGDEGNRKYRTDNTIPWDHISSKLTSLFTMRGRLSQRCNNWKSQINDSELGFKCLPHEKDLSYDPKEWFEKAVLKKKPKIKGGEINPRPEYSMNETFQESNWKYFHYAAESHRFFVLRELLPEKGIICG